MTMLAEVIDAVIGIDTHRDSHEVEIADAAGRPMARMQIGNDGAGFAQLLAAIAAVAPGPRVAVSVEGSRSYGIGLTRTLAAAGLLVIECEQPSRKQRRGKGKSGPIDAHLAVLAALRLDMPLNLRIRRLKWHTGHRPAPGALGPMVTVPVACPFLMMNQRGGQRSPTGDAIDALTKTTSLKASLEKSLKAAGRGAPLRASSVTVVGQLSAR
jgi:hypothetical protein